MTQLNNALKLTFCNYSTINSPPPCKTGLEKVLVADANNAQIFDNYLIVLAQGNFHIVFWGIYLYSVFQYICPCIYI